jgi:hypothetical protein
VDPFAVILLIGGSLYCFVAFFCYGALFAGLPRREVDTEVLQGGGGALLGAGTTLVVLACVWHLIFRI